MSLPNAALAIVSHDKVIDYLLNEAHPDNGGKARFFESLGFSKQDPDRLVVALKNVAEQGTVVKHDRSVHGDKYLVDGHLMAHVEKSLWPVRTVWIIDHGGNAPRLVTAYPGKERPST